MTKTFCDRCGKEIHKDSYAVLMHRTIFARQRLMPSCFREEWKDADKYICPECEDEYIRWFMNLERAKEET